MANTTTPDTWTLKIDNQSDITDPWVVFTDAPNVAYVDTATGTTTQVANNTGIQLSTVKDATFNVTTIADVMFVSDKELDLSKGNPNPTNDSDPNNDARWQPVEFKSKGSTMYCDVTYVNYYCIPVALGDHGKASSADLAALRKTLSAYGAVQKNIILSPANGNPGVTGTEGHRASAREVSVSGRLRATGLFSRGRFDHDQRRVRRRLAQERQELR